MSPSGIGTKHDIGVAAYATGTPKPASKNDPLPSGAARSNGVRDQPDTVSYHQGTRTGEIARRRSGDHQRALQKSPGADHTSP